MPITLLSLLVTAAIFVIEIEEVLVAKIALEGASLSNCLNIFNFKSTFSVAASIIKSLFFIPSEIEVNVVILCNVFSLISFFK